MGRESFNAGRGGPLLALKASIGMMYNDEVALHTLLTLALDVSALRLVHNSISVLYQRFIDVYAPSKNVHSKVCQCAKHQ